MNFKICLFPLLLLTNSALLNAQCDTSCIPAGNELIVNGDFTAGNTGFTSAYIYCNTSNCLAEGMYAIGPNPTFFHPSFLGSDHTTGTGNLFIANGSTSPNQTVWEETVSVSPNTCYILSAWVASMYPSNPAQLVFLINNVTMGLVSAPTSQYLWVQFKAAWMSGSNTTATIRIVDNNTFAMGNDFGLDDISFKTCCGPPVVTITGDTSLCMNDSIGLNAGGGSSYLWSTGDTSASIWVHPTSNTMYYVTVSDSCGASTDSVYISVHLIPPADAGPDTSICFSDSVQIGGSPTGPLGSVYYWSPAAGLSNTTDANPMASPSSTTWYTVQVTDTNGCLNKDSCLVTVNSNPVADAGADVVLCINDSVQLNATGGIGYQWFPSGSLNNPNISNPWASPTVSTTYYVTVTNSAGCTDIDSVIVDVDSILIDAGPDLWLCPGDTIQINATGPGGGVVSWTPATGLDNPNVYNPWVTATDTITYYLSVTDTNGCSNIDSMTVIVNTAVPTFAGEDKTICLYDSVVIGGNPTSVNGTSFLWIPSTGLNDNTLANPTASPSTTTTYIVYSTNDTCTGKDTMTVFVNPLPQAEAGPDKQFCTGDSVQLLASGGISYIWSPSSGLSNDTIANPWAHPADTTVYYVLVTDSNGCSAMDSVTVIFNPLPVVDGGPDIFICPGDSGQLVASGGVVYNWTPGQDLSNSGIYNPWASPDTTTWYYVQVTDTNNCVNTDSALVTVYPAAIVEAFADTGICYGDSVQLEATGGVGFLWSPAASLDNDTVSNPWAQPADTTVYYVIVTDANGCTGTDSVVVIIYPLPPVDAGLDQQICIGDSVQLQASGANGYTWSPSTGLDDYQISNPWASPTDTTVYYLTGIDQHQCINKDSVMVIVNPLPIAEAGNDTNICKGGTAMLGGMPTGPSAAVYAWSPAVSLDNDTLANPSATPETNTTYTVWVTDSNGCKNMDSIAVYIFSITSSQDTSICNGDSLQLFVNAIHGHPSYSYVWNPSDYLISDTVSNPWCSPATTTTYSVTVTDSAGCSEHATVTVVVSTQAIAGFTTELNASCNGIFAEFRNTSQDAASYAWDFGDGETSTEENTSHIFDYNSSISVVLTAYSDAGCSDTALFGSDVKSFEDYYNISIPNVFSPNGDGINDWFEIEFGNKLYDCTQISVYNRWGELIFQSQDHNHSWDGRTFSGEPVPEGVYFYTFSIREYVYKGTVLLLR